MYENEIEVKMKELPEDLSNLHHEFANLFIPPRV